MKLKTHKKGLPCGVPHGMTSDDNKLVTCKKCLKQIKDKESSKFYDVEFYDHEYVLTTKTVKASSSSAAIYKCFKMFRYDAEFESISEQFKNFISFCEPKARLNKDENIKPSLTWTEEQQLKEDEIKKQANDFDSKYPIGTKVLFQADFTDKVIVTTTRSKAQVYSHYLTIFLDGVSGSYHLDDRFVRVLTEENKDLERLR